MPSARGQGKRAPSWEYGPAAPTRLASQQLAPQARPTATCLSATHESEKQPSQMASQQEGPGTGPSAGLGTGLPRGRCCTHPDSTDSGSGRPPSSRAPAPTCSPTRPSLPSPQRQFPQGQKENWATALGPQGPWGADFPREPVGKTPERGPMPGRSPTIPVRGVICSPRKKGGDIPPSPAANPLHLEGDKRQLGLGSHVSTRGESVPRIPASTTVPPGGW